MPTGDTIGYDKIMKNVNVKIKYLPDNGLHSCKLLEAQNRIRTTSSELPVRVFKDNDGWNMSVGLEFIRVIFCPYCGVKL